MENNCWYVGFSNYLCHYRMDHPSRLVNHLYTNDPKPAILGTLSARWDLNFICICINIFHTLASYLPLAFSAKQVDKIDGLQPKLGLVVSIPLSPYGFSFDQVPSYLYCKTIDIKR
jgi:hypothetical protein